VARVNVTSSWLVLEMRNLVQFFNSHQLPCQMSVPPARRLYHACGFLSTRRKVRTIIQIGVAGPAGSLVAPRRAVMVCL